MNGATSGRCSIIVPTRNRLNRLRQTLTVLSAQTYPDIEIIISDDGSSDATAAYVESVADERVRLVRSEHQHGVAEARNRGISAATGEWLAFCDDDDLWLPGKLALQIAALKDSDRPWTYGGAVQVDEQLRILGLSGFPSDKSIAAWIAHGNPIPGSCSSVIVHRECIRHTGGFDSHLSLVADWDLWLRLYQSYGPPVGLRRYVVLYVLHAEQMTRRLESMVREIRYLREAHADLRARLGTPPIDSFDEWAIHSLRRAGRRMDAVAYAWSGSASRSPRSCRWLWRALVEDLTHPDPATAFPPRELADARRTVDQVRLVLHSAA